MMLKNTWVTWLGILVAILVVMGLGQLIALKFLGDQETPSPPPLPALREGAGPEAQAVGLSSAKLPQMLQLGADWCPVCRRMKPILAELRKEYKGKAEIIYIDVDKREDVAEEYNVDAIPVQVFFNSKAKQVFRHEGFWDKKSIKKQFAKMGIK